MCWSLVAHIWWYCLRCLQGQLQRTSLAVSFTVLRVIVGGFSRVPITLQMFTFPVGQVQSCQNHLPELTFGKKITCPGQALTSSPGYLGENIRNGKRELMHDDTNWVSYVRGDSRECI